MSITFDSNLTEVTFNGTDVTEVIYNGTSVWTPPSTGITYSWVGGGSGTGASNIPSGAGDDYVIVGLLSNSATLGEKVFWHNTTKKLYRDTGTSTGLSALSLADSTQIWIYYPWAGWYATSSTIHSATYVWAEVVDSDNIADAGQGFGDYVYTSSLPQLVTKD
jgi:hypothetical protein